MYVAGSKPSSSHRFGLKPSEQLYPKEMFKNNKHISTNQTLVISLHLSLGKPHSQQIKQANPASVKHCQRTSVKMTAGFALGFCKTGSVLFICSSVITGIECHAGAKSGEKKLSLQGLHACREEAASVHLHCPHAYSATCCNRELSIVWPAYRGILSAATLLVYQLTFTSALFLSFIVIHAPY